MEECGVKRTEQQRGFCGDGEKKDRNGELAYQARIGCRLTRE